MFVHQHHLKHLLRPEHYYAEEHHRLELEHLFRPAWHPVVTADQLRRPGDFVTFDLFGTPLLLRNMDGELCCFLNVCAHRHARLTGLACGHSETLRCQYHGWEYKSDGRTGKIPEARLFRPWDRENRCLRKFRVECWGELVFVCLDPNAPDLMSFIAPIPERWGNGFEPPFRLAGSWHSDFACNWKVVLENSLESYHIPSVHPDTFKVLPPELGSSHILDERYTIFRSVVPNDVTQRVLRALASSFGHPEFKFYEHNNIHPHITLVRRDAFRFVQTVYPTSPTTCRYHTIVYSLQGRGPVKSVLSRLVRTGAVKTVQQISREDSAVYGEVQRGLSASPFPGVIGAREERVYFFQKYVLERTGQSVDTATPQSGDIPESTDVSA